MTDIIRAPWTPDQVAALNEFQHRGGVHPFTCGGDHAPGSPVLIAREDGWHCPQPYGEPCDYTQDWAHAFMADRLKWFGSFPPSRVADDASVQDDPRQPAYDAVFAYIRSQPRDFLPTTVVGRNAMIWDAVHAALDAVGVPGTPAKET
ncbi:hypothetical protein [Streptomyces pseudovenezuelae]|uniref:hypothetical protein n=1 Tax=Streptomyces pseudovenezuelae TaxID=67350 RepID=UPI0036E929B0